MIRILTTLSVRLEGPAGDALRDAGLLLLRAGTGLFMALGHGWGKLVSFPSDHAAFADPIGVGPSLSMALAVFAEFFCGVAVALGLATRLAAFPLLITMLVAAGVVHAADPWARKEFALLYAIPFAALMLAGPGRFSLDALIVRKVRPARPEA